MIAADGLGAPFEWITGAHRGARYDIGRWLFLRALGLVFLIAFASLWVQVQGLIGPGGILPAADYLASVREQAGAARFWFVPTLLWLGAGRAALHLVCGLGVLAALALMSDLRPRPALLLCWALYLSLVSAGQDFLQFQWDALLLETGLLALFVAPPPRRRPRPPASALGLFLLWFLLFRLMFESGAVKLISGDPTWRNLTALDYHFFTQPLPTWTAWFANLLPGRLKATGVVLTFLAELGAPWLIFFGRRLRLAGAGVMLALQLLIAATGNYTFFNLLAVSLLLPLVDDTAWRRLLPGRLLDAVAGAARADPIRPAGAGVRQVAGIALLVLGSGSLLRTLIGTTLLPGVGVALQLAAPLESINSYGLFRVMTTRRPEIIVEGSDDGAAWREYRFRDKPGEVTRRPGFVEPHQPRLDWQMWFAALGSLRSSPWFAAFLVRLLQGSPEVLGLLGENPFPDHPPRYVRALLYDYRFSTPAERRRSGAWWVRTPVGVYCPPVSLDRAGAEGKDDGPER